MNMYGRIFYYGLGFNIGRSARGICNSGLSAVSTLTAEREREKSRVSNLMSVERRKLDYHISAVRGKKKEKIETSTYIRQGLDLESTLFSQKYVKQRKRRSSIPSKNLIRLGVDIPHISHFPGNKGLLPFCRHSCAPARVWHPSVQTLSPSDR